MKKIGMLMLTLLLTTSLWAQEATVLTQEEAIEVAKREAICRQIVHTNWFGGSSLAELSENGYWIVALGAKPNEMGAMKNGDGDLIILLTPDGKFKDYMRGF